MNQMYLHGKTPEEERELQIWWLTMFQFNSLAVTEDNTQMVVM